MVGQEHLVGAVGDIFFYYTAEGRVLSQGIIYSLFGPAAENYGADLPVEFGRQFPRFGEKLEGHPVL